MTTPLAFLLFLLSMAFANNIDLSSSGELGDETKLLFPLDTADIDEEKVVDEEEEEGEVDRDVKSVDDERDVETLPPFPLDANDDGVNRELEEEVEKIVEDEAGEDEEVEEDEVETDNNSVAKEGFCRR